ncbi:hypothetical protein [Streptomyces sp. NPDC050388]|uniref:hypothetical protein n=1 Tax=Streptomyces sp. NPDC050388 TaxID=3155781 RepID=UPI0034153D1C
MVCPPWDVNACPGIAHVEAAVPRRGIDVPDTARKRVRAGRDLGELECRHVRAYEVRGPEGLFCSDD